MPNFVSIYLGVIILGAVIFSCLKLIFKKIKEVYHEKIFVDFYYFKYDIMFVLWIKVKQCLCCRKYRI